MSKNTARKVAERKAERDVIPMPRPGMGGRGAINLNEPGQPLAPQPRELRPSAGTGQGMLAEKMAVLREIARIEGLDLRDAATRYEGLDLGQLQGILRQVQSY